MKPRGFSLLEALVGVAIATAFLGAIAVFTTNLGDARARLARGSREIECAEAVFTALERACATAVLDAGPAGDGIDGDGSGLRIIRCGVGLGDDGGARYGDFVPIAIRFDSAARRITVARGSQSDVLTAPVRALRLRYLTAEGWEDSFRSADFAGFPVAIEASIWFERGDDAELLPSDAAQSDRRRLVRVTGGPRLDALSIRRIEKDERR